MLNAKKNSPVITSSRAPKYSGIAKRGARITSDAVRDDGVEKSGNRRYRLAALQIPRQLKALRSIFPLRLTMMVPKNEQRHHVARDVAANQAFCARADRREAHRNPRRIHCCRVGHLAGADGPKRSLSCQPKLGQLGAPASPRAPRVQARGREPPPAFLPS